MELLAMGRVVVQVLEEVEFCLVSVLQGRVEHVGGVFPAFEVGVLVKLAEGIHTGTGTNTKSALNLVGNCMASSHARVTRTDNGDGHGPSKVGKLVGV